MTISLLIWCCLAGHQDNCRVVQIASGFATEEQCQSFAPLMYLGWSVMHKEVEIRDGTRPICTDKANWLMNRFGA